MKSPWQSSAEDIFVFYGGKEIKKGLSSTQFNQNLAQFGKNEGSRLD